MSTQESDGAALPALPPPVHQAGEADLFDYVQMHAYARAALADRAAVQAEPATWVNAAAFKAMRNGLGPVAGIAQQRPGFEMPLYASPPAAAVPAPSEAPELRAEVPLWGEEWERLAWHLCAEEHGEDACNDLLWEGGPQPEPWGDRWLKYEGDAKRLIALVREHVPQPAATSPPPAAPAPPAQPLTQQEHNDMDRVTVRYVRFLSPGSFVANDWEAPVDSADPLAVRRPENAYAFTMHERVDVLDGSETFKGAPRQIGPTYYHPDSKIRTLAEVMAAARHDDRILISNMRGNKWDAVIYSRWGNWPQPYEAGRTVILGAHGITGEPRT